MSIATIALGSGHGGPIAKVADAIRAVRPEGVDSRTKTDREYSHQKDLARMLLFYETVRSTRL